MKTWRDKEEFKARVLEWADKLDVKAHSLAVRPMRRKWASCSTAGKAVSADEITRQLCCFITDVGITVVRPRNQTSAVINSRSPQVSGILR